MAEYPRGTLTFLFTDIEGSARLWSQHRQTMEAVLARHDAVVRGAIEENGGHVFKALGDGFASAFTSAPAAIQAAVAVQDALGSAGLALPLRVRIALHSGSAQERDGDDFGPALNRVARLLATGHGGQVLLSLATEQVARECLPDGVTLRDLGRHRLPDFDRPEQVFQVLHPGLEPSFPPLLSLDHLPNNLPLQLTSFIGRERELETLRAVLDRERLLTLWGPGGCGKTRLALQLAADRLHRHPDGVWLIELAPLADPALAAQTVLTALGSEADPDRFPLSTLVESLRWSNRLLILDNCEHLVEASADLADALLRACPDLRILATSREPLRVASEVAWAVPALSVPDPESFSAGSSAAKRVNPSRPHLPLPWAHRAAMVQALSELQQSEASGLFIERARAVQPGIDLTAENAAAVAQICWRLDGIPLAIEMAAARVRSLTLDQIADRLDDCFRLLTGGPRTALPRQQTLRAAIDWSYDLLTGLEQVLLGRLSVFAGGWTLEAAEAVCGGVADGAMEYGSGGAMVTPDPPDATTRRPLRGHPLHHSTTPTLNAPDVLDLLTSLVDKSLVLYSEQDGEGRYRLLDTVRQYAAEKLGASGEAAGMRRRHVEAYLQLAETALPELQGPDQTRWLARLEREHGNFRAALQASAADSGAADENLRLAASLWLFWYVHCHWREGMGWLQKALARSSAAERGARPSSLPVRAQLLSGAGNMARLQRDYTLARGYLEESLEIRRSLNDPPGVASALNNLALVARDRHDYSDARRCWEESLDICRDLGDRALIAVLTSNLGGLAGDQGDYDTARTYCEESLEAHRELGNEYNIAIALHNLGEAVGRRDDYRRAWGLLAESLELDWRLQNPGGMSQTLRCLADVALRRGDPALGAQLAAAAEKLAASVGALTSPADEEESEALATRLRQELASAALETAWKSGKSLTAETVLDLVHNSDCPLSVGSAEGA